MAMYHIKVIPLLRNWQNQAALSPRNSNMNPRQA